MASRKIFFRSRSNHIHPAKDVDDGNIDLIINRSSDVDDHDKVFEFDESDIWNYNSNEATTNIQDGKKPLPSSRAWSKKLSRKSVSQSMAPASLPVNIPDWSQILKGDDGYKEHGGSEDGDDDGDGDGSRVPPHEYLATRRGASFSVHEGIGRTLKGRDLRCVRNAVWKKTGFED